MKLYRILILTICAYALISCGGAEERKAVYMDKAKASIKAGDLDKARIELKNVLQIDPKTSEAYYLIGKVYEQQKDYRKAYANYTKAEELNPELLANQARLGRIYLFLINDVDKAQEKIDYILTRDPENVDGLYLKAAMALKNNDEAGATTIAEGIINKSPDNVDTAVFLAALYEKNNKLDDAIRILEDALKNNKSNVKLSKFLGLILVRNKDYERAEGIYKSLLENSPDSRVSYKTLAAFYNESGDKTKAEQILRDSVANDPEDADRYFDLIKYISIAKSNKAAINELKGFVKEKPYLGNLRIALGEFLYVNNKQDEAIAVYKKAIQDFPEEKTGVDARITLATIYMSNKEIDKASEVIEEALVISPNDPTVNLLLAKIALNEKNAEKAIIALRIVNKETPENIEAYILLAKAYRFEGNDEQANNILTSAYENNKSNPDALLNLSQLYLTKDIDLAEKIIDDYNNLKDSDYKGISIKAAILNQKKNFAEAYKLAEKLMEDYPDKPNGYLQAIPFHAQKGEKGAAISILEKGYLGVKDNRKILMLLSSIQISEKQFDIVEKRIKAEIKASPDDAVLIIALAKVYLTKDDAQSATPLLLDLVERKTTLEEPYLLLTRIYSEQKNLEATTDILEKGTKNITTSTKIPLRLATIYEFNKEYDKAIEVYRNLYLTNPDNAVVINNFASLLSDHSNNKDDLEMAKSLVVKLKELDNPIFLDTIGWFYYRTGDYTAAIDSLKKVVEKNPDVNIFNYHLGMAYKMSGDKTQAKLFLEKSLADNKKFNEKELAEDALKSL